MWLHNMEGDMGVYGIVVLSIFSSSILVILILMCGIAESSSPAEWKNGSWTYLRRAA